MADTVVVLTSGASWTVPADWNNAANRIGVFGAGGGAAGGFGSGVSPQIGAGGGGGAYSENDNVTLTPGDVIAISIGAAGSGGASTLSGGAGGDTWFSSTAVLLAKGGAGGITSNTTDTLGGAAAAGVGAIKYSGGTGSRGGPSGGGGGGAAGPNGNGGSVSASNAGGTGDAGTGGAGGALNTAGGNGTEFGGSGAGGGSGAPSAGAGIAGGNYGGGGSGGRRLFAGGNGGAGAIIIIYTPVFTGGLAATEGADTASGTGTLTFSGTLGATEGADTASGTGTLGFTGDLAATEGADTAAVTGTLTFSGALAATEGADAFVGAGTTFGATLAATEGIDIAAGTVTLAFAGDLAATDGADTAAGTGTLTFAGDLAATEAADTAAGTALLFSLGALGASELADAAQMEATLSFSGTLGAREDPDGFAATGFVYDVRIAASEAPDTASFRLITWRRYDDLLPQSSPALLKLFAAASGRIQDIPVPIDTVKQPLIVTASFLPFVAWEYSVDVWFNTWPETTKRAISARSLLLHQRKGTAYCIREYVRYAGGTVLAITRPPIRVFSGPSLTRAQRERWLAALPQVRVWLFHEPGQFSRFKAFAGGRQAGRFVARSFLVPSTALSRLHRRARWVVDGVETDIRVTEFGSYFRLAFPSVEGRGVFSDRVHRHRFFIPSTAWRRLVTIEPQARLPWQSPVGPTLAPVTSEPERVTVAGTAGPRVFSNAPPGRRFFVPSSAPTRIFDRYAVNDGRTLLRRAATHFTGTGRYGFPTHTAILRVSIPGKRCRWAAGSGIIVPRQRFYLPHDGSRVGNVMRAVQSAKRLSDKILLKTGPRPRFVAGHPFFAGRDALVVGRP